MVFLCFVFLWWCGDVFVVVFCVFVVVRLCFCGGVVVFLWWCDGVFVFCIFVVVW